MEITDVSVSPVDENKLRAYVNITIDDCFMIRGLKVIKGNNGLFVAMPNKKSKNGMFRDVAHPLNSETRRMIEKKVLEKYQEAIDGDGELEGGGEGEAHGDGELEGDGEGEAHGDTDVADMDALE
jgi:stage V sporulation protein G